MKVCISQYTLKINSYLLTAFQIVMIAPMVGWASCRIAIVPSAPFDQGLQRCLQRARRYLDGAIGDEKVLVLGDYEI